MVAAAMLLLQPTAAQDVCPAGEIVGVEPGSCSPCPSGYVAVDGTSCKSDPNLCTCGRDQYQTIDGTCVDSCPYEGYEPHFCACRGISSTPRCDADLFLCDSGHYVSRDIDNDCEFKSCPASESEVAEGLSGGGMGDPHFRTWADTWYDFHGICDLVLVHSEDFAQGLGLDIHLRTKGRYQYSYIESAAIKIGNDILEVGSWGEWFYNGVAGVESAIPERFGGFPLVYNKANEKKHQFIIQTGGKDSGEVIVVGAFKDMVSVNVEKASLSNFGESVGLMGNYKTGSRITRDGLLVADGNSTSDDVFCQSWQVLESEPQLFQTPSKVPFGTCVPPLPKASGSLRRRLAEESIQQEAAEDACSHYKDEQKREMCVFDVIAMGDLEVASAGAY